MGDGAQQRQELADKIRQSHLQSSRKLKVVTLLTVSFGVIACLAALYWFQFGPAGEAAGAVAPNNATDDYGFELTQAILEGDDTGTEPVEGTPRIQVYEDFLCESCKIFHEETGGFLTDQVTIGAITLSYHPFAFLLTQSTDEYSQRATNAAVCVADEAGVIAYVTMHGLLLEHQPAEGGPGLSDDELIEFASESGASDASACIEDRKFTPWVEEAAEAGLDSGVKETPTVRVDGLSVIKSVDGRTTMPGEPELEYAIGAL